MHKLMEYICDELEQLERKAEKDGKLSMAEIEYADKLTHMKKNLLKIDEMTGEDEYSNEDGMSNRYSYARGGRGRGSNARRDSMGRYSSEGRSNRSGGLYRGDMNYEGSYRGYSRDDAKEELAMQLRDMEQTADEDTKHMIKKWIKQLEQD